ncbi:glycosyltransferase [Paracoccus benzoatiresistens]|uniref:Glycosyltransferase n=1 Tax=Paracoccus benzoatiresistens TaxID=2997341 RepID=A0ABT4JAE7_9RHOB|nr:glycosyltransferase [Paracoccus sp. EF6]MCZ0963323.1 glycosyltransferase [Paracoccus sp. EF6]
MTCRDRPAIGYVINTYPRPSHSFIRREILALEAAGWAVHRFAMRGDAAQLVDPGDQAEHARTERILEAGPIRLGFEFTRAAVHAPDATRAVLQAVRRRGVRHLAYAAEAAQVAKRVRALGIRHLHAHFGTNSTDVARFAARLAGIGYSFTTHGPEEFDAPLSLRLGEKLADARFAVAISNYGRSQLCRWVDHRHWERIHVIHCGIEPARFPDPPSFPVARPLRLVAIGRFSEQKGFLALLPALAAARRHADIRLTLVGEGELRPAIEVLITTHGLQDAVTLTGWLDEADVRSQLAASHALVLPSFAEGLPMVIMEAMAQGRPVLGTAIAGVPELVRPGETGWLVPAGDEVGLCEAMIALAATPVEVMARMGLNGRARVLAHHDVTAEAEKLGALFTAACTRPAA